MKAVSNTTPLRYLIAIEQEHLLGKLFEKVLVPVAVHEELTDSSRVAYWASSFWTLSVCKRATGRAAEPQIQDNLA